MKIQLGQSIFKRLRSILSKKYLDWAEGLPRFRAGTISFLQGIRDRDRKNSTETYTRTRPPRNTDFKFESISLFEMFQIEDYKQVQKSVLKLFPHLDGLFGQGNLNNIDYIAEQGFEGGWSRIGTISRKKYLGSTLFQYADPKLPIEASRVEIMMQKILPSTFVIRFDIKISEDFSLEIKQLQRRHYIPEVLFGRLVPWKLRLGGYSTSRSEQMMKREILKRIERMQKDLEAYLKPYFSGFFFNLHKTKGAFLPALSIFSINGIPVGDEEWKKWEEESRWWHSSLGFEFLLGAYGDEKLVLTFPDRVGFKNSIYPIPSLRLTIFEDAFLEEVKKDHSSNLDIPFYLEEEIEQITPLYVLQKFLDDSQNIVRVFRNRATRKMKGISHIKTHFKLSQEFHYIVMLIDSITQEFEESKKWLTQKNSRILKLEPLWRPQEKSQQEIHSVEKDILAEIEFKMSRLKQQITYLKNIQSDYLSIRNTLAIYRLQAMAAYGAVFAIIIAILEKAGIIDSIISWIFN